MFRRCVVREWCGVYSVGVVCSVDVELFVMWCGGGVEVVWCERCM